jgi:hypothetical protein
MTLRETIAAVLEDPQDRILAQSILGTTDADAIASRVAEFVARQLDRTIVGCPLFIQSVGAVFGLDLDDGARVATILRRPGLRSRALHLRGGPPPAHCRPTVTGRVACLKPDDQTKAVLRSRNRQPKPKAASASRIPHFAAG